MDRLVILGRPGGGKSTLSNHIVTTLAHIRLGRSKIVEKLPGWSEDTPTLPVRIVLREFASWVPEETKPVTDGLVWNYLEFLLDTWGCTKYIDPLKQELDKEGGLIIFDGLDEVREDDERKRTMIVKALKDFAAPLDKCRIIVTCREYAYKKDDSWRLPEADFTVVELELFADEQVKTFTETWYKATAKWKGWDLERCSYESGVLYKAVKSFPHLKELAQYPLLLTLMAQVHGRDRYLPQDRADLYERAVMLLLSHWENRIVRDEKGGLAVEQGIIMKLGIRSDAVRKTLENVALEAHKRQLGESGDNQQCANISREDLRQELKASLGIDWNQAEEIIGYIHDRAGLLLAKDNKTFTFPHRTFQEFLAAACIKRMGDFEDYLKERIYDDLPWWREVFLLAAGSSRKTPKNIHDLVDALISESCDEAEMTSNIVSHAILAAQAMDETGFTASVKEEQLNKPARYSRIHRRVQGWLLKAITDDKMLNPVERSSAGTALAKIGDPRFDPERWYLPKGEDYGFVTIKAGEFQMGSTKDDSEALDSEFPRHKVKVPEFYISRYPVTVSQFSLFIEDSGYDAGKDWQRGADNHPVVYVSWNDASAYCDWLSKKLNDIGIGEVRLPTEAEWEKAARGENEDIYPWRNKPDCNKMNYNETVIGGTTPVGCFSGSNNPYGLSDMNGNVWEWVEDDWHGNYKGAPEYGNAWIDKPDRGSDRVIRGGSWAYNGRDCRSAYRFRSTPGHRGSNAGFRLVLPSSTNRWMPIR